MVENRIILKLFTDEHLYKNRHFIIKARDNGKGIYLVCTYENEKCINEFFCLSNSISKRITILKEIIEYYVDGYFDDLCFINAAGCQAFKNGVINPSWF